MKDWLSLLDDAVRTGGPAVMVTIVDAKGSAPREAGVKMLVTETATAGTVGGGNLEHEAIRIARDMIERRAERPSLRRFALGPSLGQCCGGDTRLLFEMAAAPPADWMEPLRAFADSGTPSVLVSPIESEAAGKTLVTTDTIIGAEPSPELLDAARHLLQKPGNAGARLWRDAAGSADDAATHLLEQNPGHLGHVLLIGAGHVGKALVQVLGTLPFAVTWADNRPEQYPEAIPANVRPRCTPHLERVIDEAPAGAIYLVMTYSHDLDYALCARVLQRGDFRYLGLIGSRTKRARFERTMADLGIERTLVERVVCPIGLAAITSKQPAAIAVATAAQLLALAPTAADGPGS